MPGLGGAVRPRAAEIIARQHDPTIIACAQLGSGLRVWDVREPKHPKEIAYCNTGTVGRGLVWKRAVTEASRDAFTIVCLSPLQPSLQPSPCQCNRGMACAASHTYPLPPASIAAN